MTESATAAVRVAVVEEGDDHRITGAGWKAGGMLDAVYFASQSTVLLVCVVDAVHAVVYWVLRCAACGISFSMYV